MSYDINMTEIMTSEVQPASLIKNDLEKIRRINHTISWLEDGNKNYVIREREVFEYGGNKLMNTGIARVKTNSCDVI